MGYAASDSDWCFFSEPKGLIAREFLAPLYRYANFLRNQHSVIITSKFDPDRRSVSIS